MSPSARCVGRCLAAVLLIGCDGADATAQVGPAVTDSPRPERKHGARALPPFDCRSAIEEHLSTRADANRCRQDRDCTEIWPGLCPHGPFYADRDADLDELFAQERRIAARCEVPTCEPPKQLGIARCVDGTCVAGRPSAESRPGGTCSHYRETYLEPKGAHDGTTATDIRGDTPRVVVVGVSPGTLRGTIDWPRDCTDCKLAAWSGRIHDLAALDAEVVRSEDAIVNGKPVRRVHFELPVPGGPRSPKTGAPSGGPVILIPTASAAVAYRLRTELLDETGHPGAVTRHGTSWDTACEARR